MSLEDRDFNARQESVRLIAHALQARDQNEAFPFTMQGQNRYRVSVEFQSEEAYLADAERILDAEIVRMAEERIMARIRSDAGPR